jgi:hypothetical protein
MTSLPFQFPVLAFGHDVGKDGTPGREDLDHFVSPEDFSTCVSWKLKYRDGMILVDSSNSCWTIIGCRNLGVMGRLWKGILRSLFQQSVYRVSCELSEPAHLSLDLIKDRVCSAIDADPDAWREEDVPEEGWDDPWEWTRLQLEALTGKVAASRSVREIIDVLWPSESENSR